MRACGSEVGVGSAWIGGKLLLAQFAVITRIVSGLIAIEPVRDTEGRQDAAHPGRGTWVGAGVASLHGPLLRPGSYGRLWTTSTRPCPGWVAPGPSIASEEPPPNLDGTTNLTR
jgi:hypothetical protein